MHFCTFEWNQVWEIEILSCAQTRVVQVPKTVSSMYTNKEASFMLLKSHNVSAIWYRRIVIVSLEWLFPAAFNSMGWLLMKQFWKIFPCTKYQLKKKNPTPINLFPFVEHVHRTMLNVVKGEVTLKSLPSVPNWPFNFFSLIRTMAGCGCAIPCLKLSIFKLPKCTVCSRIGNTTNGWNARHDSDIFSFSVLRRCRDCRILVEKRLFTWYKRSSAWLYVCKSSPIIGTNVLCHHSFTLSASKSTRSTTRLSATALRYNLHAGKDRNQHAVTCGHTRHDTYLGADAFWRIRYFECNVQG